MTSKRFFISALLMSAVFLTAIAGYNIHKNEYGLFGDVEGKSYGLYDNERKTKYLFTYNYIPSNFDGVVIGPSLSDNLNTKKISETTKIYNASLNGGNISELRYFVDRIAKDKGKIRFILVCLDPYLTKDSGRKTSNISYKDFLSSLGSVDVLKYNWFKTSITTGGLPTYFDEYGFNNFNIDKVGEDSQKIIAERSKEAPAELFIDPIAYQDLDQTLQIARDHDIQVMGYFFPRPYSIYKANEANYAIYQQKIRSLFKSEDLVWDFNTEEYAEFRKDYKNYSDGVHLSDQGSDFIVRELEKKLKDVLFDTVFTATAASQFKVNESTTIDGMSERKFTVTAATNDPQIELNHMLNTAKEHRLSFELETTNENQVLQVFYKPRNGAYSESNSVTKTLHRGTNTLNLIVPAGTETVRIDPMNSTGTIQISDVNIIANK